MLVRDPFRPGEYYWVRDGETFVRDVGGFATVLTTVTGTTGPRAIETIDIVQIGGW